MKLFAPLLIVALSATLFAQEGPKGADQAKQEIDRRGPCVQIVDDQIRDEGMEAFWTAVAIPADDSHKFFLTVVYEKKNDQTDKLKDDLLHSKDLEAWVQCKDRGKGTYDVYSSEESFLHVNFEPRVNPFKKDRWKFVKPEHCPLIVLQVPKSGEWGKDGVVVNQHVGYNGKPAELSEWIRQSVWKYSQEFAKTRAYKDAAARRKVNFGHAGHKQEIGAYTAPFDVMPMTLGHGQNPAPPIPPDLVPLTPPGPKPLTLEQIKAAVPNADSDFILMQLAAKPTSADAVRLAWALLQLEKKPVVPAVNPTPEHPIPVAPVTPAPKPDEPVPVQAPIINWLIGSGVLMLLLDIALKWFGAYAQTTPAKWDDVASSIASKIVEGLKPALQQRPAQQGISAQLIDSIAGAVSKKLQAESATPPSAG